MKCRQSRAVSSLIPASSLPNSLTEFSMRLSRYFLPILKENPREAEIVSHRLMLRAGMIRQQAAGSFSWLPLGKRVLDKVCRIVR
jgi:hypothetical protein